MLNYEFISKEQENFIIDKIKEIKNWEHYYSRRRKQYGYEYRTGVPFLRPVEVIPDYMLDLNIPYDFNQVIINEYTLNQGISSHVDAPIFGDNICSLTVGSPCNMLLKNKKTGEEKTLLLERRSLLVLSGEYRNDWTHGIPKSKKSRTGTRYSLTFRKYIYNNGV